MQIHPRLSASKLVPSPLNPDWLIPKGWENILGARIDYRLGNSILHLLRVQFNQHVRLADLTEPHAHPHHQLLYYQRGSGRLEANEQTYEVSEGSIFFVRHGCKHHFQSNSAEAVICFAIDFSIDEAAYASIDLGGLPIESEVAVLLSLLHAEKAKPFHLGANDQRLLDHCIEELVNENENREVGFASLIQAHLLTLIALCLRATQRASGFGEHFRHTSWRYHLLTERVLSLIREHATREPELTLTEVARICGTSYNHLNRILKKQTNRTFHQLLLRHRLEHARTLLENGKLNCTEAAFESGFHDSNYFSRAFRKVYGHSPSALGRS